MVIADDSTSVPGSRPQFGSQGFVDVDHLDSDSVPDSEEERTSDRATQASSKRSSGHNLSSNRHTNEGDRVTGQRPTQDGAPPSNVLPPRMSKQGVDARNVHESLNKNHTPGASRRTGGHNEHPTADTRREGNEPSTGGKRLNTSSDGRPRDSRDGRGPPHARGGGVTEAPRRQRPQEEPRRTPYPSEEKGVVEGKEDVERPKGTGAESRQHGSSVTRSYAIVVDSPPDPKSGPQRERKPSPSEAMPGGLPKGDGAPAQQRHSPPHPHAGHEGDSNPDDTSSNTGPKGAGASAQQRHSTPYPHARSEGHFNTSSNTGPQDRRGLDPAAAQASSHTPLSSTDTADATESQRPQAPQEHYQGGSGKWSFGIGIGRFGGILPSSGSAPRECKECKGHEDTIARMTAELQHQRTEIHKLTHQRNELGNRAHQAERELQSAKESIRFKNNELSAIHKELEDSKALSDTRGKELIGSQAFLSKADSVSMSELVELTRTLNNEIFQTAASISEHFRHEVYMDSEEAKEDCFQHVSAIVGRPITWFVDNHKNSSNVNPLLVQIALQALISAFCVSNMPKWYYGSNKTNDFIEALYETIRQTENQAVSGRWRALTRARLRPDTDSWTTDFLDEFHTMLRLGEWDLDDPELKDALTQKLHPIFAAASKLRIALGEQFTSADIEVFLAQPETAFNAREMEDEWGDARSQSSSKAPVGGTTGVGLKRRVMHGGTDEIVSYETVLPPKVVLIPSLQEIVAPPPPRPKRKKIVGGDGAGASGS